MFQNFFSRDNARRPVEPSTVYRDEQHRDISFAGCSATLDRTEVDSIRLMILDCPFAPPEIKIAAWIIRREFNGIFEFKLEVKAHDKGVDFRIIKEGRGQPLKLKITLENIDAQLQLLSNDREQPCFGDLRSSQEFLRREAAFGSMSSEQVPLVLARVQLEPMERAVHVCVGRAVGALVDAGKLNLLPIIREVVDEALQEVSATAVEVVAKKYSGIEFAPIRELSEGQLAKLKSSERVPLPSPPSQFGDNFVLVDAALHLVLSRLEDKGYIDLDEDACRIVFSALAEVYAKIEKGDPR